MLVSNCTCVQGEDASVVVVAAMVENRFVVVLCGSRSFLSFSGAKPVPCYDSVVVAAMVENRFVVVLFVDQEVLSFSGAKPVPCYDSVTFPFINET
jgi:hypothetical protein